MTAIGDYLKQIQGDLKAGDATEHTHRPALKSLIENLREGVKATNEPKRIQCGAPDFVVSLKAVPQGYVEAKDVNVSLDKTEETDQLGRYFNSLGNLILTDYLEFRLYRNGDLIKEATLATWKGDTLKAKPGGADEVASLFDAFFDAKMPSIKSPRELAERMARMARLIHDLIRAAFKADGKAGDLHAQYEAFKRVLIADLSQDQFADMYAQTIAYGLFAARCNYEGDAFTRELAGSSLPKTNPFLRRLFNTIAGPDLDERITWAVEDLAALLQKADIDAILADFGKMTRQEDPVVHFYETFLGAYDAKLRETRGVYYTPEPVVDYIVRSVDKLLIKDFGSKQGIADNSLIKVKTMRRSKTDKSALVEEIHETHRVQILDPACGTGTFIHAVVSNIREKFNGNEGLWPGYVAEHLLPRIYGFELLMAPYAVAHMKLGLQLKDSGYDFNTEERLRIYLTNTLEEAHEMTGLPLFTQWLADEAAAADEVKRNVPIMVVIGNPPYSGHSANKGPWIKKLIGDYVKSPELKKPAQGKWLSDDYVKFFRFAQWHIEQTGQGILAFVTNHSYLDNPTFMDMRKSLMDSFDDIYVLDLHGNSKKREKAPNGIKDVNVFDIQQGVAVALLVRRAKRSAKCTVNRGDLWGPREDKYAWLEKFDASNTAWTNVTPTEAPWRFVPEDGALKKEYEAGWSLLEAFSPVGDPAAGFVTTHDEFAISWTKKEAIEKVEKLLATANEAEARELFALCKQNQWNYGRTKKELADDAWKKQAVQVLFRPFDVRWTIWNSNVAVHRRERVNSHLLRNNLALLLPKQTKDDWGCLVSEMPAAHKSASSYDPTSVVPLYLYEADSDLLKKKGIKHENFDPAFRKAINAAVGYEPTPEEVLAYIYAVLYSPTYRVRYASFLRTGFPRIPMPTNDNFEAFAKLGQQLIDLHLMHTKEPSITKFPTAGKNRIDKFEFTLGTATTGSVAINATQSIDGIPEEAWNYTIGGHAVAKKWLKDRKGRSLSFDELQHYASVISAITATIRIEEEIDELVDLPD